MRYWIYYIIAPSYFDRHEYARFCTTLRIMAQRYWDGDITSTSIGNLIAEEYRKLLKGI